MSLENSKIPALPSMEEIVHTFADKYFSEPQPDSTTAQQIAENMLIAFIQRVQLVPRSVYEELRDEIVSGVVKP